MIATLRWFRCEGPAFVLLLAALCVAGCSSESSRRRNARAQRPIPPMAGSATLLEGTLKADIRVGALQLPESDDDNGSAKKNSKGRSLNGNVQVNGNNNGVNPSGGVGYDLGGANVGANLGGNGGLGLGGNIGGMGGGHSGRGGPGGPRDDDMGGPPADSGSRGGPGMGAGDGPLALIRLRFTNQGKEKVSFRIVDFLSPVGNFVVLPDHLTLAPGQSAEVEPMSSQLVTEFSQFDVNLVLRTAATTDKQVITVKLIGGSDGPGARPEGPPREGEPETQTDGTTPGK